jgi:hypothetical protein
VIINVIEIKRNQSLIVLQKYGSYGGIFVIKAAVEMQNNLPFCD